MFTGLVQHVGNIENVDSLFKGKGRSIAINVAGWAHAPVAGESIAVNGCCLTVAELSGNIIRFDVTAQTVRLTTLGEVRPGDAVNLEQAVTPSTMLGGHLVQGHVDGVGIVVQSPSSPLEFRLRIAPPGACAMRLIVDKGSIAVDGVSLTVAAVGENWFEVALIPTTLRLTNLGRLRQGNRVNIEFDYIAKIVANWLERRPG
jgi:riboflavin synthase